MNTETGIERFLKNSVFPSRPLFEAFATVRQHEFFSRFCVRYWAENRRGILADAPTNNEMQILCGYYIAFLLKNRILRNVGTKDNPLYRYNVDSDTEIKFAYTIKKH